LLDFLCELYYDAWIHEHQIIYTYIMHTALLAEVLLVCQNGLCSMELVSW